MPEHERFLLFPTLYQQQREQIVASAQTRYDVIAPSLPGPETRRLNFSAEVVAGRKLATLTEAEALRGQHLWRDEVIVERFDWGREHAIHALALPVGQLPHRIKLPQLPGYGGCKSWLEVSTAISTEGAVPVLDDAAFAAKVADFHRALN